MLTKSKWRSLWKKIEEKQCHCNDISSTKKLLWAKPGQNEFGVTVKRILSWWYILNLKTRFLPGFELFLLENPFFSHCNQRSPHWIPSSTSERLATAEEERAPPLHYTRVGGGNIRGHPMTKNEKKLKMKDNPAWR